MVARKARVCLQAFTMPSKNFLGDVAPASLLLQDLLPCRTALNRSRSLVVVQQFLAIASCSTLALALGPHSTGAAG